LAREEGIFVGNSAGSAIKGVLQLQDELTENDVVVVLFHDHGSRYVGKIFNDDWMRERGFLEEETKVASDLVARHEDLPLVTLYSEELVSHAVAKMRKHSISQIPVVKEGEFVGCIDDVHVFQLLIDNPDLLNAPISSVMRPCLPIVEYDTPIEHISRLINKETPAVIVKTPNGHHIITRHDLIAAMA
jgi:cystathionine beta-synthase